VVESVAEVGLLNRRNVGVVSRSILFANLEILILKLTYSI
jgi:hypothetical protein